MIIIPKFHKTELNKLETLKQQKLVFLHFNYTILKNWKRQSEDNLTTNQNLFFRFLITSLDQFIYVQNVMY